MAEKDILERLNQYGADTPSALRRFIGNTSLYINCLNMFVNDDCFSSLGPALKSEEYKQAFDIAHTIKGVSANLELLPMVSVASEIVDLLRSGEYSRLHELYSNLLSELSKVRDIL